MELLEKLGVDVYYPSGQTCCGQPLGNSGYEEDAKGACKVFVENFKEYDYIVCRPLLGIYNVKKHFDILEQTEMPPTIQVINAVLAAQKELEGK